MAVMLRYAQYISYVLRNVYCAEKTEGFCCVKHRIDL